MPDRPPGWSGWPLAAAALGWISAVLVLDARGSLALQHVLGVATWALLVAVLAQQSPLVRLQTAVVVVFATAVEYTFSPLLEVYLYRFDNVPAYVPPGHGLVYVSAMAIAETALVRRHLRACVGAVAAGGGAYALYGITLADRPVALGAFWFGCLVCFLRWGPSPGLYVGAFIVVP